MKITLIDKSEIPKLKYFDIDLVKAFLERHKNDNDGLDYSILKHKEFWNLCENPKPYVYFIKNKAYITRDSYLIDKLKGGEKLKEKAKMVFVEKGVIPVSHAGRTAFDIEASLSQIPDDKAWKIGKGDYPSIATIRDYVKKKASGKYDAVQRKGNLYVSRIEA